MMALFKFHHKTQFVSVEANNLEWGQDGLSTLNRPIFILKKTGYRTSERREEHGDELNYKCYYNRPMHDESCQRGHRLSQQATIFPSDVLNPDSLTH